MISYAVVLSVIVLTLAYVAFNFGRILPHRLAQPVGRRCFGNHLRHRDRFYHRVLHQRGFQTHQDFGTNGKRGRKLRYHQG